MARLSSARRWFGLVLGVSLSETPVLYIMPSRGLVWNHGFTWILQDLGGPTTIKTGCFALGTVSSEAVFGPSRPGIYDPGWVSGGPSDGMDRKGGL